GKSVSALSILGLLPRLTARVEGKALLEGRDLLALDSSELRQARGREIAMVFQDPATSLNPVLTVGYQLTEGLREHLKMTVAAARERAAELLTLVGVGDPGQRLSDYPHQFSGGQRQRIMIAMALAARPSVLVADEPTTALDVTIQAQIVDLVKRLQKTLGMAIVWITHDLALAAGLADKVAVMYAGYIVEQALARDLFRRPRHPYTLGLLRAMPRADGPRQERLEAIPGAPPDLREDFHSCPFAPRCAYVVERCREENPPLLETGSGHQSACWRWEDV
ncbi:MAG TPA: ABC transporter ATP-binding protein, partial [Vicinamibacteria bacterium]|nr:ABC transporter ATP-binding protein [Vicinamibacteria bacterium]